jgi:uncharacterized protein
VTPSAVWDGADLLNAFATAASLLTEQRAAIDALNVYPVPDGDTGTNMSLTMEAALNQARGSSDPNVSVGAESQHIAHGSLLGARGNSGVILSQIYRGFAQGVAGLDTIDGRDLAHALRCASDMAYKAVMQPVEGTMLTVIRVAAEHAEQTAQRDPSLVSVLASALEGAGEALANTPNLLEKLRQAGVVDSGGQGIVVILQGFLATATGERPQTRAITAAAPLEATIQDELDAFGYCTNFMIIGQGIPFEQVRTALAAMGRSAVIVGDDTHIKVHLHTENPGQALEYAIRFGALEQIKIDNMDTQVSARASRITDTGDRATGAIAVLAVASGAGIADAFRSVGVAGVVGGGQTMNPSVEELLHAVNSIAFNAVILLPNNGNVLLAAQHMAELAAKDVRVVPTRTIAQGLAAAAAFRAGRPLEETATIMERAMRRIHSVEVSRADKDASMSGLRIQRGQFIGIVDDRLDVAADDLLETTTRSIDRAVTPESELITIFTGDAVDAETPIRLVQWLTERHQDIEVELVDGGQPHYQFVIGVE